MSDPVAEELAGSPTAQGSGPTPDYVPTDQSTLVAQPGDNTAVDINGNPTEIAMPEENARRGLPGVPAQPGTYVKGIKGAFGNPDLNTTALPADLEANQDQANAAVDASTAEHEAANNEEAAATKRYNDRVAELNQQQADLDRVWAGADERSAAAGAQEAHKYVAAFTQQMAAVRQMAVDPTGPIASMSTGAKAGLTLAAFAQGFLAVRGINIDVTGQIDKWVEQSIHEQERRINQAQAGAEDQLHLLEIARQTSHDEAEAKLRYRGMIVSGIQGQITAQAAVYKSDVADAQAKAMNAQLDMEVVKTKQSIWNTTQERVEKAKADKETEWYHRASIGVEYAKIDAAKEKAASKGKAEFEWINDPETGKPTWAINKKDKEAVKAARESATATQVIDKDLQALQDISDRTFGANGENPGLFNNTPGFMSSQQREFKRTRDQAVIDILNYGRIHKFPKDEVDKLVNELPGESVLQRGDNVGAISAARENYRRKFQATMDVYSEPETRGQVAMPGLAEKETVRQAGLRGGIPVETPVGAETANAELRTKPVPKSSETWRLAGNPGAQPESAVAVDHLALALAQPAQFRRAAKDAKFHEDTVPADDRELRRQSEDALRVIETQAQDPATRNHARRILEIYHEHGATGVRKLFAVSGEVETPAENATESTEE